MMFAHEEHRGKADTAHQEWQTGTIIVVFMVAIPRTYLTFLRR